MFSQTIVALMSKYTCLHRNAWVNIHPGTEMTNHMKSMMRNIRGAS
jgi:hypothetical protein